MVGKKNIGIGRRLLEIREAIAHRQTKKLAEMISVKGNKALSVSATTVSSWINGEAYPRIDFALKAARLYGKSLDWLVSGQDPPRPRTFGSVLDEKAAVAGITLDPDVLENFKPLPQIIAAIIEIAEEKSERKAQDDRTKAR